MMLRPERVGGLALETRADQLLSKALLGSNGHYYLRASKILQDIPLEAYHRRSDDHIFPVQNDGGSSKFAGI